MTMAHGPGGRAVRRGRAAAIGSATWSCAAALARRLGVAAEPVTHRGEQLLGEGVLLARAEAREERRRRARRRGTASLDRGLRPSSGPRRSPRRAPEYSASVGLLASATAVRSRSHELTTLPRRQSSAISASGRSIALRPAGDRLAGGAREHDRSPPRRPASGRTRCRCAPSSRNGRRRTGRSGGSPPRRCSPPSDSRPGVRRRSSPRPGASVWKIGSQALDSAAARRRSSGSSRARAPRRRR